MFEGADEAQSGTWRRLAPVAPRWPWITGGLALQLIGVGAPVAYVLEKAHKEDVSGQITRATLQLGWRDAVHSHAGLALLVCGALVFVAGSMVLARPFVTSWVTLFVAVPLAALAGVLVLGAAAILVALLAAGADDLFSDWSDVGGGGSRSARKRKPRQQEQEQEQSAA